MSSEAQPRIRLYTHNIFNQRADWEARRNVLRSGISAMCPDIIMLQETMVTDATDQVAELLAEMDYDIVHGTTREPESEGVSIASRWPILATHEVDLKQASSRTGQFACTALAVEIAAPAPIGSILVVNHFPDYRVTHELERERQAVLVARFVEERVAQKPVHVLLGGDLDAESDAASLRFLAGRQSLDGMSVCYRNCWEACHHAGAPTFTGTNSLAPDAWPFQQIDHLLIRCGDDGMPTLAIESCSLAFDQPVDGIWGSDHFGLVADFAHSAS